ncbi:MAG: hypothetical protein ACRDHM_06085 [Actinomycetota bacterium]
MRLRNAVGRRSIAAAVVLATCGVMLFLPATSAVAHESRVLGDVVFVAGWGNEPTFAGFAHPVEVFLSEAGASEEEEGPPISDADLEVEVFFGAEASGDSSGLLPMDEAFGEPGHFEADMIPTRPGTYTFHFTGTVAGQEIDEVFTSGPDTFSDARIPSEIQFPEQDPTNGELAESIERLSARVDNAGGGNAALWAAIGSGVLAVFALVAALRRRAQP